ncbi:hypothetical protein FPZ49_31620 [Paenibacillus cremeus]|uniref:Uncharacterized protein n=1 Tax=Paenibacillus cremeus TaxID=2163881 RepID=A0A559JRA3_9BACL|nr:hypothetical protein FPZ49_31620 [Paenibacillus cremeus]
MTEAQLAAEFGRQVLEICRADSEPDKGGSWEEHKQHTLDYLKQALLEIREVACADKLHNLQSIRRDLERIGEKEYGTGTILDKLRWFIKMDSSPVDLIIMSISLFSVLTKHKKALKKLDARYLNYLIMSCRMIIAQSVKEIMMHKQRELKVHSDFERMRVFQQPLSIYQNGKLLDENVVIESHNEDIVVSRNGDRYFKSACVFIRL